jgi:hypothetical protein
MHNPKPILNIYCLQFLPQPTELDLALRLMKEERREGV